jgi:N-terminal region of glycosyl transferase group 7
MIPCLGIIVPYRDRKQHLDVFLPYMRNFFRTDNLNSKISCRILIVEQIPGLPFNRGAIKNIGFAYLAPQVDSRRTYRMWS